MVQKGTTAWIVVYYVISVCGCVFPLVYYVKFGKICKNFTAFNGGWDGSFLTGNPCSDWDGYRSFIIAKLPHLKVCSLLTTWGDWKWGHLFQRSIQSSLRMHKLVVSIGFDANNLPIFPKIDLIHFVVSRSKRLDAWEIKPRERITALQVCKWIPVPLFITWKF